MARVIIMPKQGQSVESCIITEIKKKEGDIVNKGDILFAYETDKASFEEESPVDGVVLECFYDEGNEVPVLENMMIIGEPGEDYSDLIGAQVAEESKPVVNSKIMDAMEALKALGYKNAEIQAISKQMQEQDLATAEAYVKLGLQLLLKRKGG